MAPLVAPLAQSESKTRFFARLGLDPSNPVHKQVYALMKEEAVEGRRRLLRSQDNSTAQIHKVAWRREARRIYEGARTETKAVYEFGENPDEGDNWIIRWMLWHVFRYRDYRNRPYIDNVAAAPATATTPDNSPSEDDQQTASSFSTPTPEAPAAGGAAEASSSARGSQAATQSSTPSGWYWDPVRERWLNSHS